MACAAACFRVLGPVEAVDDRGPIPLGGSRQRLLLAVLLTAPNRAVSVERIVAAVWPDGPPRTATGQVRDRVRLLRRRLGRLTGPTGGDRLGTRAGGYALQVAEDEYDVELFAHRATEGRRLLDEGQPEQAADRLRSALELWRGQPLQGLNSAGFAEDIARWEETRSVVHEHLIDTQLELGRHTELLGELASLTAANPLRERFYEQWMLALYRSQRRSDALEVFRRARTTLAEELGLEPGNALQGLHQAILAGDPALDRPPEPEVLAVSQTPARRSCAPNQLPPDVPHVAGRRQQLTEICAELAKEGPPGTAVVVISGPAGVGKTTLAVRAAHALRPAFAGGQLYVDLSAGNAIQPYDVQAAVLRGLRVTQVPDDPAERTAAYRSALAGQSSLLVLDDAADEAQVRPLLPGFGCAVLVTSRRRLTGLLDARHLPVGPLTTRQAVEILGQVAGRERVAADPVAAKAVVAACSHLPLAVKIAAARLAARPYWPIAALADRLADEDRRLAELTAGDLDVRASLVRGLCRLGRAERALVMRLARRGGGPVTLAELAGDPDLPALDELLETHVVSRVDSPDAEPRFWLDDLVRLCLLGLPD
ncbi:AfsR/SARP family transcriptional regulator [Fodinicola acaciae]|uniref:AfsR/SARP family transcriptional regulator n=1 Tax=Fodinicola acaciae TaxID=2681555 RepID=UPI0013D517BA|nr:BTAD domain-containing putative transcriptional regulator [Fodinicola acaciae]